MPPENAFRASRASDTFGAIGFVGEGRRVRALDAKVVIEERTRLTMASADGALQPVPKHLLAMETGLSLLEAACRAAVEAPSSEADLRPLASALERGIVALLDAYDVRRDPVAAVRDAMQACDEAAAEIERAKAVDEGLEGIGPWLVAARDWLLVAEDAFARTRHVAAPPREIAISRDVPALQRISRSTIAPIVRVAEPRQASPEVVPLASELAKLPVTERIAALKQRAKSLRDDAAKRRDERHRSREEQREARRKADEHAPHPGFAKGRHERATDESFVVGKARELFEDVAAMSQQRTPLVGDYWRAATVFDERMLRDIDAVASLGGVALSSLERLVVDAPAKDPARAFAIGMVLGCFEGRDALAAVERAVRFLGLGDLEVRANITAALKLAPHPELGTMMRRWLSDTEPGLRAIAIDVLAHRGLASPDELAARCRDDAEEVAAKAYVPAALTKVSELGVLLDERPTPKNAELATAIVWATVLGGVQYAVDRARKRMDAGATDAALLPIALAGERADVEELLLRFRRAPSRALASALGYGGLPSSLPVLVDALDAESAPELKQEVAFALQRITGAELYDQVEIPAEAIEVPDTEAPRLPDDAPPLRRLAGDRRDRPGDGSADRLSMPTMDPAAWRAFLAADATRWEGDRRLRRGQPYTPALSLSEIDTYQITGPERRILFYEIVIKTGAQVPFDPIDFVNVQEEALRALAPIVEKASSVPGAWGRALRR